MVSDLEADMLSEQIEREEENIRFIEEQLFDPKYRPGDIIWLPDGYSPL